jgi:ribonucleoside-diphosphate reductase alpha chain
MQLNKDAETAQWLEKNKPEMLEESVYSASHTDYVVFTPCENPEGTLYKDEMQGIKHLELIKLVQKYWVREGAIPERAYNPLTEHNVSNTVIIDDKKAIVDYLYKNQDDFTAVAFMSNHGDKDWNQAPFTSVLDTKELVERYGDGVIFMSGLIVDGLHYFQGNLWEATNHILDKDLPIEGTRSQVLLRKDWLRRAKQFAKNYLKGDIQETVYCMKDVHLWHKWNQITKGFKPIDFTEILTKPTYVDINTLGAVACAGGACEI